MMMKELYVEKTASRGIVIAPIYKFEEVDLSPAGYLIGEEDVEKEITSFENMKAAVMDELSILSKDSEIFAAHLEIADDFMIKDSVYNKIIEEQKSVQIAVFETMEEIAEMFASLEDDYMRERSADVKDVSKRFMASLKGITLSDLSVINKEVIVVAKDLFPSDTVKLDGDLVKGIITQEGGVTGHVCIMANSMNIPIIVGAKEILDLAEADEVVCMDAEAGHIVVNPTVEVKENFAHRKVLYIEERKRLEELRNRPIVDKEGKNINLCVNIGDLEELKTAMEMNIHGVGLFRSEFLYMENTDFPTEEEQFAIYSEAAKLSPKEVTIRTLDIGGDKSLSYYAFEEEENPFLGWRAIRISLELKEMFKTQLRAILRASAFGHVRIMFPMIISVEELIEAKSLVEACKKELIEERIGFDENIQVGMMIETPSSVLLADEFATYVDFFSIGTNDLTQYLLAVDRGNKKIASMYNYFHPAVVKAITQVILAGHKAGIPVGMCGEMAGDIKAIPLLMDLGLDEFSMSSSNIDYARGAMLDCIYA